MSEAAKAAAEAQIRNERRQVLYQRLLADRDFNEFIVDEWWGDLMTEVTTKLEVTAEPVELRAVRDVWNFMKEIKDHMKNTVKIYREAEAARVEDEKRREAKVKEGRPPEEFDE